MNIGIITAAGLSERFGPKLKQFVSLAGRSLLSYSINAFAKAEKVDGIVLVVQASHIDRCRGEFKNYLENKFFHLTKGGKTRQESVAAGLTACPKNTKLVWIHDGARPLITSAQIDSMVYEISDSAGVILAAPSVDTVKIVEKDIIVRTINREQIWMAQTPQLFKFDVIAKAHTEAADKHEATDDAALVEQFGGQVAIMPNKECNLKVTTQFDLQVAELVLQEREKALSTNL